MNQNVLQIRFASVGDVSYALEYIDIYKNEKKEKQYLLTLGIFTYYIVFIYLSETDLLLPLASCVSV